jgi:hypothetical protein
MTKVNIKPVLWALLLFGLTATVTAVQAGEPRVDNAASVCVNFNAGQAADIDYLSSGVRNLNSSARPVVCSVPRRSASQEFFIRGDNFNGQTTFWTFSTFRLDGTFRLSRSASSSAATYADEFVSVAGGAANDIVSVVVTLPPSANGILRLVRSYCDDIPC